MVPVDGRRSSAGPSFIPRCPDRRIFFGPAATIASPRLDTLRHLPFIEVSTDYPEEVRMAQKGFLLVLMQPPSTIEEEFNAWYDTEHVPERLSVPGVETAVRFCSTTNAAPKYLAMYDLAAEAVLDTDAYKNVAGDKSSPWTKRVTGRTKVYRSVGSQIFPGSALTVPSARVTIVRFRGLAEADGQAVITAMREIFESRSSTLQLRVFAYHVDGKVDFIGFVSSSVPDDFKMDVNVFGKLAGAIDLFNSYAPL
jgi:hypothetical protein